MQKISRRNFAKKSAALSGFFILPSGLWANSPNGRICTAHIGVGGQGSSDLGSIASHAKVQVLGLCDVDTNATSKAKAKHKSASTHKDYRAMLSELGDKIDAVVISTPDHTHFPATVAAMNLGKHVYTQKPLTHKVEEARKLMNLAREKKLVTQMGIQVQSSIGNRMAVSYIQSGVIGKVSKVYVWSNKNWGYDGPAYTETSPVPKNLDWNLWLGTAQERPFLKGKFHPGNWRRLLDYGCGTLGDMGVHIFDSPFLALGLKIPKWVEMECRAPNGFGHPTKNKVHYGFESTKHTTNDFTFTWWDGRVPTEEDAAELKLPGDTKLPSQGALFVGEEGTMLLPHGSGPRFFPRELVKKVPRPELKPVSHYHQFIDAIDGKAKTTANFDYSAPFCEALLLGVTAAQFPGKRLEWDAPNMKVPNLPEANAFLKGNYRKDF